MTTIDYPNIREQTQCPVCNRSKDTGLIVCWTCYRALDFRHGIPEPIVRILAAAEEKGEGR